MLLLSLLFGFLAMFILVLSFVPLSWDGRPKLKLDPMPGTINDIAPPPQISQKKSLFMGLISRFSFINKAFAAGPLGQRVTRDLGMARLPISAEEFILIKQVILGGLVLFIFFQVKPSGELLPFWLLMSVAIGYYLPEMWLRARSKGIKEAIVKDLPDTVDLLGLCVNAGLDFMMALKYVIEKSHPSVIIEELKSMMQEINVGKPRRDALRDMARKYELPDLSTFARTLIQADRMGTSVTEALNILSEDMREARFRRGEAVALKAPMKMLIPLLLFIFPVVAILVAGPVFLDFFQNNPLQSLGK